MDIDLRLEWIDWFNIITIRLDQQQQWQQKETLNEPNKIYKNIESLRIFLWSKRKSMNSRLMLICFGAAWLWPIQWTKQLFKNWCFQRFVYTLVSSFAIQTISFLHAFFSAVGYCFRSYGFFFFCSSIFSRFILSIFLSSPNLDDHIVLMHQHHCLFDSLFHIYSILWKFQEKYPVLSNIINIDFDPFNKIEAASFVVCNDCRK